jgi:hypothetical protein
MLAQKEYFQISMSVNGRGELPDEDSIADLYFGMIAFWQS